MNICYIPREPSEPNEPNEPRKGNINKKRVMKRAWEIKRKTGMSFSESLKKSWRIEKGQERETLVEWLSRAGKMDQTIFCEIFG